MYIYLHSHYDNGLLENEANDFYVNLSPPITLYDNFDVSLTQISYDSLIYTLNNEKVTIEYEVDDKYLAADFENINIRGLILSRNSISYNMPFHGDTVILSPSLLKRYKFKTQTSLTFIRNTDIVHRIEHGTPFNDDDYIEIRYNNKTECYIGYHKFETITSVTNHSLEYYYETSRCIH